MQMKLKNDRITQDLIGETFEFPKYTTQIMNLANQNAQGTRPRTKMRKLAVHCAARAAKNRLKSDTAEKVKK